MKIGESISEGTIVVLREDQMTSCGINYVRAGSIVKVAFDAGDWASRIKIFRNKKEEDQDNWHIVERSKLREAKEIEIDMWNKEIYFVESVKTY